jgi:hypothetical protein
MDKKYECDLYLSAEETTTGTMMVTKEEYEFLKRVTDLTNWNNLNYKPWCGHLQVYCRELETE